MKNIVILLSAMLFMVACEKGNEEMKEAKVVVSVYDENGKLQRAFLQKCIMKRTIRFLKKII